MLCGELNPATWNPRLPPGEEIEKKMLLISGRKVMLDSDLAELYVVEKKTPVRAVKEKT